MSASLALIVSTAAGVVLLLHWYLDASSGPLSNASTARLLASVVTRYLGHVLAALALGLGSSLIAVASLSPRWRLALLTQLLLSWVSINVIAGPLIYAEQGLTTASPAVAALGRLFPWSALVLVLAVAARCLARRPPGPVVMALTFLSPFVAALLNAIIVGAVRGWGIGQFPYQPMYVSSRFLLWYLPFTVLPVIVIWLTVEGLRLNRDLGLRLIARIRVTPRRVVMLAGGKITFVVLALLALPGSLVGAAHRSGVSLPALLACLPLALGVLVVLAVEHRWQMEEKTFGQATRLLVLMAAAWCAIWFTSYGLVSLIWMLLQRPLNLAGYVALGVVASLIGIRGLPALLRWIIWGSAVALVLGLAALPSLVPQPVHSSVDRGAGLLVLLDQTVQWLAQIASVLLPVGVLLGVVIFRRDLLIAALFVLFATLWVALSAQLPLAPLPLDLALIVLIVAAVSWSSRPGASLLTVHELALLAIVMCGVAYLPLLSSLMPAMVLDALKPLAFVAPVVLLFTMDAPMLNEPGPSRTMRVLGVTGGACFLLGVALSWVLIRDEAEDVFALVDLGKGLFTMPMALVLITVSSSALRNLGRSDEVKAPTVMARRRL